MVPLGPSELGDSNETSLKDFGLFLVEIAGGLRLMAFLKDPCTTMIHNHKTIEEYVIGFICSIYQQKEGNYIQENTTKNSPNKHQQKEEQTTLFKSDGVRHLSPPLYKCQIS